MKYHFAIIFVILLKGNLLDTGEIDDALDGNPVKTTQDPGPAAAAANRYSKSSTTRAKRTGSPLRISLEEDCDYLLYYCMRAYKTGRICARTLFNIYRDFDNYCSMDYVNCMERYTVWQVIYMAKCFNMKPNPDYKSYDYSNDSFLDDIYVMTTV